MFDLRDALTQLGEQSEAASAPKLGQGDRSGPSYYLDSLTWGLGWGAAIAAAVGVAWEWRRNRTRALLLAIFPVVLFLYLCTAGRFFARWLLPTYPVLALLAGIALAGLAARVPGRPWLRAGVLAALLLAVLAQPIAADLRTGRLLNRDDTRVLAREFLLAELPRKARIVVEPADAARLLHEAGGQGLQRAAGGARGGRDAAALHPLARAAGGSTCTARPATASS